MAQTHAGAPIIVVCHVRFTLPFSNELGCVIGQWEAMQRCFAADLRPTSLKCYPCLRTRHRCSGTTRMLSTLWLAVVVAVVAVVVKSGAGGQNILLKKGFKGRRRKEPEGPTFC